jgi:hypothetical protein
LYTLQKARLELAFLEHEPSRLTNYRIFAIKNKTTVDSSH